MISLPEPLPNCLVRVPPNVHFEVDDIEEEWTYTRKFDLIHSRYLGGAIRDWPKLVRQAYKYARLSYRLRFASYPDLPIPRTSISAIDNVFCAKVYQTGRLGRIPGFYDAFLFQRRNRSEGLSA